MTRDGFTSPSFSFRASYGGAQRTYLRKGAHRNAGHRARVSPHTEAFAPPSFSGHGARPGSASRRRETSPLGVGPRRLSFSRSRGVAKSEEHKAAISAALKAKWNDPDYVAAQKKSVRTRKKSAGRKASAAAAPRAPRTEAEKKRHKLVGEMKEIYTKASVAVRALEERKSAGLEVDEVMLKKALSAVSETRKVLESLGQAAAPPADPSRAAAKAKAKAREEQESRPTVVHVRNGERVEDGGGEGGEDDAREDDGVEVA